MKMKINMDMDGYIKQLETKLTEVRLHSEVQEFTIEQQIKDFQKSVVPMPLAPERPALAVRHTIENVRDYVVQLENYTDVVLAYNESYSAAIRNNEAVGCFIDRFIFDNVGLNDIDLPESKISDIFLFAQKKTSGWEELYKYLKELVLLF